MLLPTLASKQPWVRLPCILVLCVLAYSLGLFGGFLFDDFPNIVDKPELRALDGTTLHWLALAVSSNAGPLHRPVSMLSFGLDYFLFGLSPLAFKLTNLLIHLANGVLLYQLARRITTRLLPKSYQASANPCSLALLSAALWLLHPLNVSTVVYVVQRMDELATLFVLLGLLCYAEGRERMARGEHRLIATVFGIGVFGLLAVLSKENGALIMAYALVIELCCYRFAVGTARENRILKCCFWLTVALPVTLFAAYLTLHPQWLATGYARRDFTLYQRLLSEARIQCDYLLWILVPLPRWMGIYHDDFLTSTGLLHPATTLAAILFLTALVVSAWRLRRTSPGFTFGVAWFLVGQSMESTIIPLELVFDHRNYLPMTGLLLGLVCALAPWLVRLLSKRLVLIGCGALVLVLAGVTADLAYTWGNPLRLALAGVADHPYSARAQYEAGRQIIFAGTARGQRNAAELQAVPYFERGLQLDPTDVFSASSLILIRSRHGVPPSPEAVAKLAWCARHMRQVRINPFLVVQTAAIEGSVRLTPGQMKSLVDAALDNPGLSHSMRAMVLNNYGHYLFQIAHDNQAAVSFTLAAAAEDPANPLFEVNLTRLALTLGNTNEARRHLLKAEQLDKAGMYTAAITHLKQQLSVAGTSPST